ncbi:MAG TPA: hypothetical protein VNH11_11435 [Pirellulales bacterium]|nr:hypothetical protein [Pirellulales bacterium]
MPRLLLFLSLVLVLLAGGAPRVLAQIKPADGLNGWLRALEKSLPREAAKFSAESDAALDKAADAVEQWAAQIATFRDAKTSNQFFEGIVLLLEAKNRADRLLDTTLELRRQFASLDDTPQRNASLCAYLAATSRLIDLSGRLRYLQVDAVNTAGPRLVARPGERLPLLDRFTRDKSSVGAFFAARFWIAPDEQGRLPRVDRTTRDRVLQLAGQVDEPALLPLLVQSLIAPEASPEWTISLAEAIRRVGLPQEPWPDPLETLPPPPITPSRLHEVLADMPVSALPGDLARRHAELIAWLETLMRDGLSEPSYRIGTFEVRPGDFLLMRNPSPYNQFTDLSPGLFTHVGVVTLARGRDGTNRMVLVDLPERGNRIPAANVETYVQRSLHYCFLRHPDPQVAAGLAQAAHDVIGNESLFDLNFRLQGILGLKGQPLSGKKIETYCAGLLLLCAFQTSAPREEFFPVREHPRGGNTLENLAKLGLSMDDDFISPTGALFSQKLTLVGRREPMYDPRREVEEGVFDHFAWLLANRTLVPSPDWFQSLRLKLAEAASGNSVLAEALAKAARVNAQTDLVSAAKAAAVIETLDEIAFGASGEFLDAWDFLHDLPAEQLAREGEPAEDVADAARLQSRHAAVYQTFRAGRLSPRRLRMELVKYYTDSGKRELEQRFFTSTSNSGTEAKSGEAQ